MTQRRERILSAMMANLEWGKLEGYYREDMDASLIARLYVFRVENISDNDLFTHEELVSGNFLNQSFLYHLYGIATEKTIHYIKKYQLKNQINQA